MTALSCISHDFPITDDTVCASAPGKVILLGEHAVVYGHPAIAAALSDLRITVWITPLNGKNSNSNVRVRLADLPEPVDTTLPVDVIRSLPSLPVPPEPHVTAAQMTAYLAQHLSGRTNSDSLAHSALLPVVYLLATLLYKEDNETKYRGMEIYVASPDLPVGAGLGSSAAFSVAMAAALLKYRQTCRRPGPTDSSSPMVVDLDTVNTHAYHAEILLHGQPSGLDNAVATYGGALLFRKPSASAQSTGNGTTATHPTTNTTWKALPMSNISMLLVHTRVPRSTKALVSHVRQLFEAYPTVVGPVLQAMGALAQAFADDQQTPPDESVNTRATTNRTATVETTTASSTSSPTPAIARLLDYIRLNHNLLRTVGVSHPALEDVVQKVGETSTKVAAKLTGAGGGGCAVVVGESEAYVQEAHQALLQTRPWWCFGSFFAPPSAYSTASRRYTCWRSTLGGPGVQWHCHDNDDAKVAWDRVVSATKHPQQALRSHTSWTSIIIVATAMVSAAVTTMVCARRSSR